jgi:hypothetical protein
MISEPRAAGDTAMCVRIRLQSKYQLAPFWFPREPVHGKWDTRGQTTKMLGRAELSARFSPHCPFIMTTVTTTRMGGPGFRALWEGPSKSIENCLEERQCPAECLSAQVPHIRAVGQRLPSLWHVCRFIDPGCGGKEWPLFVHGA